MWWARVSMVTAAAFLASGCAGAGARQELARLQSQVNLLDERVVQLERSGSSSSAGLPLNEPAMETGTAVEPSAPSQHAVSVGRNASGTSSLKPSTREIQQALKNAGFYQGTVDGKMGPQTHEAVKEFQRIHGLKEDGVVGKQTWAKLKAYADLSGSSGAATAAEVLK